MPLRPSAPWLLLPLLLAACDALPPPGGGPSLTLMDAAPGALLPPGQVARACDVRGAALGTPIEAAAGYVVHDTAPGSTAPRTHYVTGFSDGCPRQVTAALAVLGDPLTHETYRYESLTGPYGEVDRAYEEVKASVCGVGAGEPCGAAMERLSANTAFLSTYPVFGGPDFADVLFHAGEVVAADPVQ